METLSHHDILALNRAIEEIYAARDMESFYRAVFSAIHGMIPYELCSCNDVSLHPTRVLSWIMSSQEHDTIARKFLPALNTHLQEHPLFPHWLSGEVVKTADYASRNQFKATGVYNEYYWHLDTETQIWFSLPVSQENVAVFALSRRTTDFSERDRLALTFLKPHLIGSLRNVRELGNIRLERDLLQRGAEAENQGVILCHADGMILCISAVAREMLEKYFDARLVEGNTLPGSLWAWFKTETLSSLPKRVEREPLTVVKEGKSLTIKLLNDFTTGDYILFMVETNSAVQWQNLQGYGLTGRESEVLRWLAKGKTNGEIATILGMSKRTAEKHLEHIFTKLGVETRGAAAAAIRKG
ncbi:MAG: helix-turn-helix transcriptional regulator [Desulfurivibrionaceae bacterium]|jgi:DNA-binding CsgD family transcriptional regulator